MTPEQRRAAELELQRLARQIDEKKSRIAAKEAQLSGIKTELALGGMRVQSTDELQRLRDKAQEDLLAEEATENFGKWNWTQ